MRLEQFNYLLSLQKTGSINKTANILHISQQAVSSSVKSLENELGVPLLVRTTKGVFLTEYGYYALECGNSIFNSIKNMEKNIAQHQAEGNNTPLTILIHSAFSLNSNDYLSSFYNEFAEYDLNIVLCQNHAMLKKISSHEANLALCYTFKDGLKEIQKSGFFLHKISAFKYGVFLNSNSPIAQNDTIPLADVVKHYPIMVFNDLESDNNSSFELIKKYNLQHIAKFKTFNFNYIQQVLKDDTAVLLGPQNLNLQPLLKGEQSFAYKFIPLKENEVFYEIFFADPQIDIRIIERLKKLLKQIDI